MKLDSLNLGGEEADKGADAGLITKDGTIAVLAKVGRIFILLINE